MRLINVHTGNLQEFPDKSLPPYAILSHTWGSEEVSFQDLQNRAAAQEKSGFYKIHCTCLQAHADGLEWAWVDTCCIDKTSSHELSEAINSMWRWYMNATVCYVYLSDVDGRCPPLRDQCERPAELLWVEIFEESKWFTRGWTLQELIAPSRVIFFGSCWNQIGPLSNLIRRVSGITGIQEDVLEHRRPLSELSVAQRLSWAAERNTTRIEDQSYSLLGILGVNMTLLYGEGGPRAFLRLQEEIIKRYTDQSLLAWDAPPGLIESRELLLAPSPRCFANSGRVRRRLGTASQSSWRLDSRGLEISLPIMRRQLYEDPSLPDVTLGILDCTYEGSSDVLALVMRQHPLNSQVSTRTVEFYVSGFDWSAANTSRYARILPVNASERKRAKPVPLLITHDLRSQPYMQSFIENDPNCFPIWFMGEEPTNAATLVDVFPEDCWDANSNTMRLHPRDNTSGAIAVHVQDPTAINSEHSKLVLITFGLRRTDPSMTFAQPYSSARRIYDLVFIDPDCSIERHLGSSVRHSSNASRPSSLQIDRDRRVIARLSGGALKVEIERGTGERYSISSGSSASSPTSPSTRRQGSFPALPRRDSVMQSGRSERVDSFSDVTQQVHRIRHCRHCQFVKAKEQDERRRAREKASERKRAETQQKLTSRAQKAGMGITLGSFLVDGLEFLG